MGVGVTGGKKVRLAVGSTPNKGCIFGSMAGMPPTIGVPASIVNIYQKETSYCNYCIPSGCKDGFDYLKSKGLITSNKGVGGIGRMHYSPGIFRLYGNGRQTFI